MNATELLRSMPWPEPKTGFTHLTDEWHKWNEKRKTALATAKEEHGKVLTDEEIERIRDENTDGLYSDALAAFLDGLRYARDNGYLAPDKGLDDYTTLLVNVLRMSDADQKRLVKDLSERGLVLDAFPNGYFIALAKGSGWISVEDRLPDMNIEMHGAMVSEQFVAMMDDGVVAVMQCQRRIDDGLVEWFDGVDTLDGPTHWMPLPAPPENA